MCQGTAENTGMQAGKCTGEKPKEITVYESRNPYSYIITAQFPEDFFHFTAACV